MRAATMTRPPRPAKVDYEFRADLWALVARAQGGDTAAVGELYDATVDQVFRFVYYRVRRRREVAEDLTADTYARGFKRIDTLRRAGAASPAAWFITIAHNLVADHIKSADYQRTRLAADPHGTARITQNELRGRAAHGERPEDLAADPADCTVAHHDALALWTAVTQLDTDDQREVIRLRFLVGLNVAETAAVMGKTLGAVKTLQFRACCALRRQLADTSLDPAYAAA